MFPPRFYMALHVSGTIGLINWSLINTEKKILVWSVQTLLRGSIMTFHCRGGHLKDRLAVIVPFFRVTDEGP